MLKSTKSGGSLQGYVDVSYNRLVEVFGEPHHLNGDKSTVEWCFKVGDVVFTIYDYKWVTLKSYRTESFHVGGNTPQAVEIVRDLLDNTL